MTSDVPNRSMPCRGPRTSRSTSRSSSPLMTGPQSAQQYTPGPIMRGGSGHSGDRGSSSAMAGSCRPSATTWAPTVILSFSCTTLFRTASPRRRCAVNRRPRSRRLGVRQDSRPDGPRPVRRRPRTTYWGTRSGLEFSDGYRGDVLLRIDPDAETLSRLGGVILDGHGVASMAATPDGSVVVAEAADPHDPDVGTVVAIDGYSGETLLAVEAPEIDGFRAMSVSADGRVFVTWSGDGLAVYDPVANTFEPTSERMPGWKLRASIHGEKGPIRRSQSPRTPLASFVSMRVRVKAR